MDASQSWPTRPISHAGRTKAVLAGFVLVLGSLVAATPAHATAACSGFNVQFDGNIPKQETNYITEANITTRGIALCGSSHSSASVWAMITGGGGNDGYAQSGYLRTAGQTGSHMFSQYTQCQNCAFYTKEVGAPPAGSPQYVENYNFTAGNIGMYVNGSTLLATTNFDPAFVWTGPWVPEWEGETHDNGDDMPGSSTSPTYFENMYIKTCRSCGLSHPTGQSLSSDSSRYGVAWNTTNVEFHIWTK